MVAIFWWSLQDGWFIYQIAWQLLSGLFKGGKDSSLILWRARSVKLTFFVGLHSPQKLQANQNQAKGKGKKTTATRRGMPSFKDTFNLQPSQHKVMRCQWRLELEDWEHLEAAFHWWGMVSPDKTRMDAHAWNYAYLTCSLAGMKGALYDHLWDINIAYDMRGQVGFALLSLLSLLGLINCHGFPSLIWRLRQSFRLTPRPVRSRFLLKSAMLDHLALSVGWLWRCHLGWHFAHLFQGQNMQVLQVAISIFNIFLLRLWHLSVVTCTIPSKCCMLIRWWKLGLFCALREFFEAIRPCHLIFGLELRTI